MRESPAGASAVRWAPWGVSKELNVLFADDKHLYVRPGSSEKEIEMAANMIVSVTFERDEGQAYPVGTRVSAHPMDSSFRTLAVNPSQGDYLVTQCEHIRDVGWKALRVSLALVEPSAPSQPSADSTVGALEGVHFRH